MVWNDSYKNLPGQKLSIIYRQFLFHIHLYMYIYMYISTCICTFPEYTVYTYMYVYSHDFYLNAEAVADDSVQHKQNQINQFISPWSEAHLYLLY